MRDNAFEIAGGTAGLTVSWQLTGVRHDPWAQAHDLVVEEDKPDRERGYYQHPEAFGRDMTASVRYARNEEARPRAPVPGTGGGQASRRPGGEPGPSAGHAPGQVRRGLRRRGAQ
jgi:hypothetical protein